MGWGWEGLKAGGEGDDRRWAGWMASLAQWTWVWVNSGGWWWIGRPGVLQPIGSQRVGHDWATELTELCWTQPHPVFPCPAILGAQLGAGPDGTSRREAGEMLGVPEVATGEVCSACLYYFVGDSVWAKPIGTTNIRNESRNTTIDSTDTKRKTGNGMDNFMSIISTTWLQRTDSLKDMKYQSSRWKRFFFLSNVLYLWEKLNWNLFKQKIQAPVASLENSTKNLRKE